jgi:hypothetical protein
MKTAFIWNWMKEEIYSSILNFGLGEQIILTGIIIALSNNFSQFPDVI